MGLQLSEKKIKENKQIILGISVKSLNKLWYTHIVDNYAVKIGM